MPGRDPRAAAEIVAGELPHTHVAELPARGLGADMIGRAAAILVDLPMDVVASGYRLGARNAKTARVARDFLAADLDAVEERWDAAGLIRRGAEGADRLTVKTQCVGPFTLAASVELASGHRAVHDVGAWRDIAGSLAEGLAVHAAELERRLGADVLVQLDEPLLRSVVDGRVPPLSRLDVNPPIPAPVVVEQLATLREIVGRATALHDCSDAPVWEAAAGFDVVGFDLSTVRRADLDAIGALLDAGVTLALGAVDVDDPQDTGEVLAPVTTLVDRIGMPRRTLAEQVILTPRCGLAGSPRPAAVLAATVKAAEELADPDSLG